MHTHIQVYFTNSVCTYRFTRIQLCFLETHVYVTCIYLSGSVRSMPKQQLAMYPWSPEYTFCDCWGTGDVISDCVGWPFWSKNWRKSQNAPGCVAARLLPSCLLFGCWFQIQSCTAFVIFVDAYDSLFHSADPSQEIHSFSVCEGWREVVWCKKTPFSVSQTCVGVWFTSCNVLRKRAPLCVPCGLDGDSNMCNPTDLNYSETWDVTDSM